MGLSLVIDITADFNASGVKNLDISNWDWVTVQLIQPASAVSFLGSNDSQDVPGALDGNALTATNFTAMQGVNLSTGVGATSGAVSGMWRFPVTSRYLQLSGTGVYKLLVYLSKIG